jgi:hypothetical protein
MANYVLPKRGIWTNVVIPTKAATDYVEGEWVYNDGTNDIPATTSSQVLRGIVVQAKASASNVNPIVIRVPVSADATFQMVATGTLTAAGVGLNYDLATSTSVAQGTTTYKPVKLVKFITSALGEFALNYAFGVNAS